MINTKITVRKTSGVSSLSDTFVVKLSKNISGITAEDLKFAMGDIEISLQEIEGMMKKAKASEEAAKLSETLSKTSETNSSKSAKEAKKSQDSAKTYETNANKSAMSAKASENAAKLSETNAKASEVAANASEIAAKASEVAANASEIAAKSSETKAKSSETASKASQDAASKSAANAKASEGSALAYKNAAEVAITEVKKSQEAAKASENKAKASEDKAKASETNSKTSETNSKTSETNSKTSEDKAKEKAIAAYEHSMKACECASKAKASETSAKASQDAASKSATAASTSSTEAKASATAAKASETKSTTEANRAKTEADRAEAAASSTEGIKPSDLTQTITADKLKAPSNFAVNTALKEQDPRQWGFGSYMQLSGGEKPGTVYEKRSAVYVDNLVGDTLTNSYNMKFAHSSIYYYGIISFQHSGKAIRVRSVTPDGNIDRDLYHTLNTSIDPNGVLTTKQDTVTLTTKDLAKETGNSHSKVMSQKAVTDKLKEQDAATWSALGTAATRNVGTATGNVMEVGAFGLGVSGISNLQQLPTASGFYTTGGALQDETATVPANSVVIRFQGMAGRYIGALTGGGSRVYFKDYNSEAVYLLHTGNIQQSTGTSTEYPMSQKIVTDKLKEQDPRQWGFGSSSNRYWASDLTGAAADKEILDNLRSPSIGSSCWRSHLSSSYGGAYAAQLVIKTGDTWFNISADYQSGVLKVASGNRSAFSKITTVYSTANTTIDPNGVLTTKQDTVTLTTNDLAKETGNSHSKVMSQKAVTDALDKKVNLTGSELTGTLKFNHKNNTIYDSEHLSFSPSGSKNYLRKMRGGTADTIWHETVQSGTYRISTGGTDATEIFSLKGAGAYVLGNKVVTEDRIVKTVGGSETNVMSQKAVTVELDKKVSATDLTQTITEDKDKAPSNFAVNTALKELGTAATMDVGTSPGQLMEVGAGGWLGKGLLTREYTPPTTEPDNITEVLYTTNSYSVGGHSMQAWHPILKLAGSKNIYTHILTSNTTPPSEGNAKIVMVNGHADNNLSSVVELYHTGNTSIDPNGVLTTKQDTVTLTTNDLANEFGNSTAKTVNQKIVTDALDNRFRQNRRLEDIDLNTLYGTSNQGVWWQSLSVNATVERHYPTKDAGSLIVLFNGANTRGTVQVYYPYNNAIPYTRTLSNESGNWSLWTKLVGEGTTPSFTDVTITSDRRAKENINVIDKPLERLSKLKGSTFNYKDSGNQSGGIIAQDLLEALPEGVDQSDPEQLKVHYNAVIGLLVNAVNELSSRVKKLEDK